MSAAAADQVPTVLPLHRGGIAQIECMTVSPDRMINYRAKCAGCGSMFLWTMHERFNTLRQNDSVAIDICFVSHDDPNDKHAWITPARDDDQLPADVILSGQHPEHDHSQRMWKLPIKGPAFVMLYKGKEKKKTNDHTPSSSSSCNYTATLQNTNVAAFIIDVRLRSISQKIIII